MRTDTRKICKSLLIASFFAVVTPAAAAGLVVGVAGATDAVGSAVDHSVFGERQEVTTAAPQAAPTENEPVATREPTPLSPLVEGYEAAESTVAQTAAPSLVASAQTAPAR